MRRTLALVVFAALSLSVTATAAVKPKPWQWTPFQAQNTIIRQGNEIVVGNTGAVQLATIRCRGVGKHVQRRFVAFRCPAMFGDQAVVVWAKTRRAGGLCWSTEALAKVPSGCLAPGKRARGSLSAAYGAFRLAIKVSPVASGCVANGAGFYSCYWTTGLNGEEDHRATVVFAPAPVVKILG